MIVVLKVKKNSKKIGERLLKNPFKEQEKYFFIFIFQYKIQNIYQIFELILKKNYY